jgi:hypothetical protein
VLQKLAIIFIAMAASLMKSGAIRTLVRNRVVFSKSHLHSTGTNSSSLLVCTQTSPQPPAAAVVTRIKWFSVTAAHINYESMLTENGTDGVEIKKNYLKMAKEFHPDGSYNIYVNGPSIIFKF